MWSKLENLPELYGRYRYHDEYYGCENCDICFTTKETGRDTYLVPNGSLSLVLESFAERELREEQNQQAKTFREKLDSSQL